MNKKTSHTKQKKSQKNKAEDIPPVEEVVTMVAALTGDSALETPAPVARTKGKKVKPQDKPHYVNSKQFEDEIRLYYSTNTITSYLADSIRRIAYGLSFLPNFINYSYKEDMIGDAVVKMYQALKYKKFQLDKGFSPFSYFTTIAFHAFISRIKKEKKHHQLIADYRERNYDSLINKDEESTGVRICSKPASGELDNSGYNESNA